MRTSGQRFASLGAAFLFGLSSCAEEAIAPSTLLTDSADVTVATIRNLPSLLDKRYVWNVNVLLSIPTQPDGPGSIPLVFDPEGGILLRDGSLLVADNAEVRVVHINATGGSVLSRFGRTGKGPGEIGGFPILMEGEDNTVWVADQTNYRVSRFTLEGRLVDEALGDLSRGLSTFWKARQDPPGLLASRWYSLRGPNRTFSDSLAWLDLSDGTFRSVLPLFRAPNLPNGRLASEEIWYPRPLFNILPAGHGIILGTTHEAVFQHYSDDGVIISEFRIPLSPLPVSEESKRDFMERLRGARLAPGDLPGPDPPFYAFHQIANDLIPVDDTTFALVHSEFSKSLGDPDLKDKKALRMFSLSGLYLGVVVLPDDFAWYWSGHGRIFGAVPDSLGVAVLQVLAITPPARGNQK